MKPTPSGVILHQMCNTKIARTLKLRDDIDRKLISLFSNGLAEKNVSTSWTISKLSFTFLLTFHHRVGYVFFPKYTCFCSNWYYFHSNQLEWEEPLHFKLSSNLLAKYRMWTINGNSTCSKMLWTTILHHWYQVELLPLIWMTAESGLWELKSKRG